MKRKKFVPQSKQHQDAGIFEISTNLEDYRMAFMLNKIPGLHLERINDLKVFRGAKHPWETFSLYASYTTYSSYYLISSVDDLQSLMKSYLLIIDGYSGNPETDRIIQQVENLDDVLSINRIEIRDEDQLKKTEMKKLQWVTAILTDLEYHMLEIKKKNEENKIQLKTSPKRTIKKLYNK